MRSNVLKWIVHKRNKRFPSWKPSALVGDYHRVQWYHRQNAIIYLFFFKFSTVIWWTIFFTTSGCAYMICVCCFYNYTHEILTAEAGAQCDDPNSWSCIQNLQWCCPCNKSLITVVSHNLILLVIHPLTLDTTIFVVWISTRTQYIYPIIHETRTENRTSIPQCEKHRS